MNARAEAVAALEARLGHVFADPALLERALTHSSVGEGARRRAASAGRDNERLEFLGDRVLGLLAAERLTHAYPDAPEGALTPRLHALVDRDACARVARRLGFGEALRLSAGETKTGGREKDGILADACEAVMAAVYLDGGLDAARRLFENGWADEFGGLDAVQVRNPKSWLQEWAQGQGRPAPVYVVVAREGPDHAPRFTVEARVEGAPGATGDGRSRQEAEKAAALALLAQEGVT